MLPTSLLVKAAAALALLAALWGAIAWWHHDGVLQGRAQQLAVDQAAATKLKVDAARKLADLQIDADRATQALADFRNAQEIVDATNQAKVARLAADLRRLAPAGQLRDPYAGPSGCRGGGGGAAPADPASAGDRPSDGAQAGGLLSPELTNFLLEQAASADEVNLAYASCRADAFKIRQTLSSEGK